MKKRILFFGAFAALCARGGDAPVIWSYWNHEPADHLRRMSYCRATIFTLGDWLPRWYGRLHGEELVSKAAELGVNMVYCHYFKGFGLKHERAEMERTKDFAKIAHGKGVKVLGYCQLDSLYYETMLSEIPELESWTARTIDGGIHTYGHYYRWSPCIESREFMDYIKRVIRIGIEEIGLDGFHFDNSYARDCHCDRCQKAFREYLSETVKDPRTACGLADFRHVRIPPKLAQRENGQEWHDPFQIWRQKFRHLRLARFHKEIFDYVKTFGADKITLHNPAYGRFDFELRGAMSPSSPGAAISCWRRTTVSSVRKRTGRRFRRCSSTNSGADSVSRSSIRHGRACLRPTGRTPMRGFPATRLLLTGSMRRG